MVGTRITRMQGARVLAACVGLAGGLAWAQEPTGNPLGGPTVVVPEPVRTIVERGPDGRLTELDRRPEFAAAVLLPLSAMERQRVEELEAARATAVASYLDEHYATFLEAQGARQSGDRRALMRAAAAFRNSAGTLLDPPLLARVEEIIAPAHHEQLRRLVWEYVSAVREETRPSDPRPTDARSTEARPTDARSTNAGPAAPGEDRASQRPDSIRPAEQSGVGEGATIPPRMEVMLTMREVARSLGSIVTERQDRVDGLLEAIEATPEQEGKLRAIARAHAEKRGPLAEPDGRERAAILREMMAILTPEQREKARAYFRGE